MSNRLHLRLFLVVAACLLGAGTAGSLIQRAAANADFREYSQLTESRSALLEEAAALQSAIAGASAAPAEFRAAQRRFDAAAVAAEAHNEEPAEETDHARQEGFARRWTELADHDLAALDRSGGRAIAGRNEAERHRLLQEFLVANGHHSRELAAEREGRQRAAILLPLGLVALLTVGFAFVLWLGVERPARGERRRRSQQDELGDALQVARREPEAYAVLARHIKRAGGAEHVTIFSRNNSADRLEAVTDVREDSSVEVGLVGAARARASRSASRVRTSRGRVTWACSAATCAG